MKHCEGVGILVVRGGFRNNLITQVREESHIVGGIVTYNSADHSLSEESWWDDVVLPPGTQIMIHVLIVGG